MAALSLLLGNSLAFLGSLLALYFAGTAVYQIFFSPLSHIPGPWYAAVSEAWHVSHIFRLRQSRAVQSMFEAYGPIVRIGPNRVAYCDAASNKRIYNNSKFPKGPFYKGLITNDNDHAMTRLDHASHAVMRKAIVPHYMPANVQLFQPEIRDHLLEVVEILDNVNGKEAVDVLHLFRDMLVDVLSASSFSHNPGALKARAEGHDVHHLVRAVDDFAKRGVLRSVFPAPVWEALCNIPNDRWKALCDSDSILATFVSERVSEQRAELKDGKLHDVEKKPFIQRMLEYRLPSGEHLDEKDVVSEHMGHFIAGVDTTGTLVTYALWELTRRPDTARKLHAELDAAMPDRKTIPDITVLEKLPYLNALIREVLRVYCPAPAMLERTVPSTDALGGPFELLGCVIPPGTIIATQSWSLHRIASVFPSPDTFLPERWLDADAEQLAKMNAHMMPFGIGIRICVGQHFAMQTARIAVATFAKGYDVGAPLDETNDRTMEQRDAFVAFPAAMRCKLTFHPRSH